MTPTQAQKFVDRINLWYPSARIAPALADAVWAPEFADTAPDVAVEALKRYARTHNGYPPSLDDLKALCDDVGAERRRAIQAATRTVEDDALNAAWQKAYAARAALQASVSAVLEQAATDPWGLEHVALFEQGLARRGREAEAAAFCRKHAHAYPEDADRWEAEAAWYERGCTGTPAYATPMSRGQRYEQPYASRYAGQERVDPRTGEVL